MRKILTVDDAPENLDIIKSILTPYYNVKVAKTGLLAIKIATQQQPDLILLDIMMPDLDGYEVCRRLKEDRLTQHIPIIFLTAMNTEKDEIYGFKLGAVDYISKPFTPAIVLARVRTQILLKSKTDLLEALVSLDGLTEIPNRRAFDSQFDLAWKQSVRTQSPLSLVMIDIDSFKQFNDYYGHNRGDDCLKSVAKALAGVTSRPDDLVARFGGEEFIALLPNTNNEGAIKMGEDFLSAITHLNISHEYSGIVSNLSISVGVATLSPNVEDKMSLLLEQADKMLYLAKQNGRNQVYADSVT